MRVFKSYSPDALHNMRVAIEAEDRPSNALFEQIARAINMAELREDFAKTGALVQRVSGTDVAEFIERMRRERYQVDASRRTLEQQKKKSQLRTDAGDPLTDDVLAEQLDGWMFERTAVQNKGASLASLSEVASLVGGQIAALGSWIFAERLNVSPNYSGIKQIVRSLKGDLDASLKVA